MDRNQVSVSTKLFEDQQRKQGGEYKRHMSEVASFDTSVESGALIKIRMQVQNGMENQSP